ncbi:Protein PSK SIMULATOR 3 [Linum perenne]
MSLWNRNYDYAVGLLARSLFTIFGRINHVFGFNPMGPIGGSGGGGLSAKFPVPGLGKKKGNKFFSGPLGKPTSKSENSKFSKIWHTSRSKQSRSTQETLGATALALHYANVIIVYEKLAASPHLISHDARDDLYSMLPASVRNTLRQKLKPYAKSLASSVYDNALAREWNEAIASILEWLSPLAHNMIRWQSDRSFEQQNFVSRTNVYLVQTLFYANQEKTEATIAELLVGLNYLWRSSHEPDAKPIPRECTTGRTFDECVELDE